VRGLKNKKKRNSFFTYMKDQNCHNFYFLQEIYSEPKDEIVWRIECGGEILYSHGTNRKKRRLHFDKPAQFNGFKSNILAATLKGESFWPT